MAWYKYPSPGRVKRVAWVDTEFNRPCYNKQMDRLVIFLCPTRSSKLHLLLLAPHHPNPP